MLLVLVALRTNLTEPALAAIFGTSQSTAYRAIRHMMAAISDLFEPGQFGNGDTLILDGTLIPVHDQAITKPSKNYRRSVNVQVLAALDRRIVYVSKAWPGNRNDIVVTKATIHPPEGTTTLTDSGYRSMPGATLPPEEDEVRLAARQRLRARIRMKDWQMLRQCIRRGNTINLATSCVAYLWNLRLAHL